MVFNLYSYPKSVPVLFKLFFSFECFSFFSKVFAVNNFPWSKLAVQSFPNF